ncbi:MAG: hypothetical protein KDD70_08430 [Bdellovibrionales bacterium]|nr:hypothetical protein [Bdellovibrionales bacterium]
MKHSFLSTVIVALFGLFVLEVTSFAAVYVLKGRLVFYNPPKLETYERYMEERDPDLGWPSKTKAAKMQDASGSRPNPAFPQTGSACVSLYGDSFTWSDPVDDEHAWSTVLSQKLGCRVANYGFGAYGTDQAYRRFELNKEDESSLVLLNHFPGDIRRNVNQLRNFLARNDHFALKPRFMLEDGALRFIPLPTISKEEAAQIIKDPARVLKYEYFVPGGSAGIERARFPYFISLLSAFQNEHIQAKMKGEAVWDAFYDKDHPSGALPLTAEIMKAFVRLAKSRGKYGLITMIPNSHDIHRFQETGSWGFQPLVDELERDAVEVYNIGPQVIAYLGGRDICEISEPECYGHYNDEGYAEVANIVFRYLLHNPVLKEALGL